MAIQAEQSEINKWLVILNKSLAESEIHQLLSSQQHRIKVSAGTLTHTCIFPQSSVAFMVVPVSEALIGCPTKEVYRIDKQLAERLTKFSELHQKCYVLLCAPMLSSNEQQLFMLLQRQFISCNLHCLPVHNASECTECMLSIARVMYKPLCSIIHQRMGHMHEHLLKEEKLLGIIQQMGVGEHESFLLLDRCGNLSSMAKAAVTDLLEYSLDVSTAQNLHAFLHSP